MKWCGLMCMILLKTVEVYTDGATSGNGTSKARGGWAYMFQDENGVEYSDYGGKVGTTNNRMELVAAIRGIYAARAVYGEDVRIRVISDSAYLINCYEQKWYINWQNNGWVNSTKKPVANQDLWEELIPFFEDSRYEFVKCAGHMGIEQNEIVDKLAKRGAAEAEENPFHNVSEWAIENGYI